MGIFAGFISGNASGKVGGLVFAKVRGIETVRAYQKQVNFRNTPAQQFTLQKNRLLTPIARWLLSVSYIGFRTRPAKQTAYSQFMKLNNPEAMIGTTAENAAIDYSKLRVSQGTMGSTPISSVVVDDGEQTAVVNWDPLEIPLGGASTDKATIAMVNQQTGSVVSATLTADRSAGTKTLPYPGDWVVGNDIHCYLFFSSIVTDAVSDNAYAATEVVS